MLETNVALPSKPRVVSEEEFRGIYEIDGLYPGYGHTLGNSLRRIILSSLPGAAITQVKIDGIEHEFSTISGVKEDIITVLLNLKRIRLALHSDEPEVMTLKASGDKLFTAGDIEAPTQIEVLNPDQPIAELTTKSATLNVEMTVEPGLGYVAREVHQKDKVEIGTIAIDAVFTPIRRVNYEVENMRVGDRTDYNRLRIFIETDGTVTPRGALEKAVEIMVHQLKAIIGFQEEVVPAPAEVEGPSISDTEKENPIDPEILKTRIETLDLSARIQSALDEANIRTIGGLVQKEKNDILDLDGLGPKGVEEIEAVLTTLGASLKN